MSEEDILDGTLANEATKPFSDSIDYLEPKLSRRLEGFARVAASCC